MSTIRALQDNVIVRFLPEPDETKGGIFLPQNRKRSKVGVRRAEIIAVGPGYYRDSGHGRFIPTTVKVGQLCLVDELAGQDYALDINVPRQNKGTDWTDRHGNMRIVREDEICRQRPPSDPDPTDPPVASDPAGGAAAEYAIADVERWAHVGLCGFDADRDSRSPVEGWSR